MKSNAKVKARDAKTTYKIMSAIKSKNTKPEKQLGRELWCLGLRYRKHYNIFGRPDFVFVSRKLAVFCDGDFWHGNNWKLRGMRSFKEELKGYSPFWREKILRNIERDKRVNRVLKKEGWSVLRVWESEIKASALKCAKMVQKKYKNLR